MNSKWLKVETMLQEQAEDESSKELVDKLQRLMKLKEGVDRDETELKIQYITLMRERNEYFRKLKLVQQVCDQNPNSGLVKNIQTLFNNMNTQNK